MYGAPLLVRGWSIMIHTLLSKFTPYGWRGGLEGARARAPMLSPPATLSSLSLPQGRTLLGLRRPPLALARISPPPPSMAWEEDPKEAAISHSSKSDDKSLIIVSFYQFAKLSQYMEARKRLVEVCELNRVSGGVILAPEGINGSICGTRSSINKVLEAIQVELGLTNLRLTEAFAGSDDEVLIDGHHVKSPLSAGENAPFRWGHVRVKVKEEIVPLGIKGIDPLEKVGKYVQPKDWNTLICDPETIIVDVRNAYETRIGKFRGALDPNTLSFKNFPVWAEHNLLPLYRPNVSQPNVEKYSLKDYKQNPHFSMIGEMMSSTDSITLEESPATKRQVATYCTGGIRCEKATSLLLAMGFKEVYHLEGGILRYLEEIHPTESLWEGECFVFDKRVSVGHGLKIGSYELCYACKKPVCETDKMSIYWEDGISCPYCFFQKTQIERDRARARQTQFEKCGVIGGPEKGKTNSF